MQTFTPNGCHVILGRVSIHLGMISWLHKILTSSGHWLGTCTWCCKLVSGTCCKSVSGTWCCKLVSGIVAHKIWYRHGALLVSLNRWLGSNSGNSQQPDVRSAFHPFRSVKRVAATMLCSYALRFIERRLWNLNKVQIAWIYCNLLNTFANL